MAMCESVAAELIAWQHMSFKVSLEPGPSALNGGDAADRAWGCLKITDQVLAGQF